MSTPDSELDQAAWAKWFAYRQAGKHPIPHNDKSIDFQKRLLAKFGAQQMAVVENSISHGWRGLFPLKPVAEPTPPKQWPMDPLADMLAAFAAIFGKVVTKEMIDAYQEGCKGLRPDELERAKVWCLKHCQFFPKPSDIWKGARSYGWL